ncbi:MAG: hypothetical protein ACRDYU_00320, partial [Actinomycetes bacterium]
ASARALVADARRRAEAERADAAARVTREAGTETAHTLDQAERQAESVGRQVERRMPAFVARAVADVRAAVTPPGSP